MIFDSPLANDSLSAPLAPMGIWVTANSGDLSLAIMLWILKETSTLDAPLLTLDALTIAMETETATEMIALCSCISGNGVDCSPIIMQAAAGSSSSSSSSSDYTTRSSSGSAHILFLVPLLEVSATSSISMPRLDFCSGNGLCNS